MQTIRETGKEARHGGVSRRDFIKVGALTSLLIGASGCPPSVGSRTSKTRTGSRGGHARNVILLVSDGMSMGTFTGANQYRLWREGRPSHWMQLYLEGRAKRGLMDMASLNDIVTDSAAASSSWGSGKRVNNGSVNMDPEGRPQDPVLLLAKAAGKGTGLVTTATVTHATPAGFSANEASRHNEVAIALQYLDREYDVILGGGRRVFSSDVREDGQDVLAAFAQRGYAVVDSYRALQSLGGEDKILGLFSGGYLPYELDRLNSPDLHESVPSLADMSRSALKALNQYRNGFVLQIEGARVDHAAHANDVGGLIFDQLAFDDAVAVALEFQENHPDTLVLITTDHGNANPALNGGGNKGAGMFSKLSQFRGTQETLALQAGFTHAEIRDRFMDVMGLEISPDHAEHIHLSLQKTYQTPYRRMKSLSSVVGQVVADQLDFGWSGNGHTSDYVELCGIGPGSDRIQAFNRNTDLFTIMLEALGIPQAIHA